MVKGLVIKLTLPLEMEVLVRRCMFKLTRRTSFTNIINVNLEIQNVLHKK